MTDFYKMSSMMKQLFPSNPETDKQALLEMANAPTQEVAPTKNYVTESETVPQGSMPLNLDIGDFAKLAGLSEKQMTGSAGQAKGSDPMPKMSKPSSTGEQPHPLKDKLVGEEDIDTMSLTPGITALGGALDPDDDFSALIARGLKKAADGIVLNAEEREAIKPYIELLTVIINTPQLRNNLISMQKSLERKRQSRNADAETKESGLQYYTGVKKHGKEYMKKAAAAGREGASQEELGRLKDKYSKAEKNKKTESIKERLYRELHKRKI